MRSPEHQRSLKLLRWAFVVAVVFGIGVLGWLVSKALLHPDHQARQFGRLGPAVPLWLPLILFVAVGLGCVAYVFWRAAKRMQAGEDLYRRGR